MHPANHCHSTTIRRMSDGSDPDTACADCARPGKMPFYGRHPNSTEPQMPTGTLTGHAIRMATLRADHTYVTSDSGHVWPCFGRGSGGTPISSGIGNISKADCLSNPLSRSGIAYGITGVCHQAANRILYPSGATVSKARGYRWSLFSYGTYGNDPRTLSPYSPPSNPWPELASCDWNHVHP